MHASGALDSQIPQRAFGAHAARQTPSPVETARKVIAMELLDATQLQCSTCHTEVFDTDSGFVHRDGSFVEDCGDEVAAAIEAMR